MSSASSTSSTNTTTTSSSASSASASSNGNSTASSTKPATDSSRGEDAVYMATTSVVRAVMEMSKGTSHYPKTMLYLPGICAYAMF